MFSNIQLTEVENAILIDQYYCDGSHKCPNKTSAVAISNVAYQSIKGTYITNPVRFACSDSTPCSEIILSNVMLSPSSNAKNIINPFCWKAFGEIKTATTPAITCLGTGSLSRTQTSGNTEGSCWFIEISKARTRLDYYQMYGSMRFSRQNYDYKSIWFRLNICIMWTC